MTVEPMSLRDQRNRAVAECQRLRALYDAAEARATAAERERDALREALRPFANIVPSTLYPADGSENEGYCVLLAPKHGNPVEYTGRDLARARAAFTATGDPT